MKLETETLIKELEYLKNKYNCNEVIVSTWEGDAYIKSISYFNNKIFIETYDFIEEKE